MRWVAVAPPQGSHRTAMPTVWAFSAVSHSIFQGGLLKAVQHKQMGCYMDKRLIYGGLNSGCRI